MNITLNRLVKSRNASIGGMKWVFKQNSPTASLYSGGSLSGDLKAGDVIFAGDFGYYDWENRLVYHLNQFPLAKELKATDTEVYFYNTEYNHTMRKDMFVTPEPTSSTSKGKAVACTSLEKTTLDDISVYKITITAGALGTASKGDIFVEAASAGTSVAPKLTEVNVIFFSTDKILTDLADEEGESGLGAMTVSPLYHATVLSKLTYVPKIAPANKCAVGEFYEL